MGPVTIGHAVDSSAIISVFGYCANTVLFNSLKNQSYRIIPNEYELLRRQIAANKNNQDNPDNPNNPKRPIVGVTETNPNNQNPQNPPNPPNPPGGGGGVNAVNVF